MSKLIMFDFMCSEGHQFEDLVQPDIHEVDCPSCSAKAVRQISQVRLDWKNMGLDPAFPSAQDKWAREQTKAKRREDSVNLKMY